jgi:hypothetical protein
MTGENTGEVQKPADDNAEVLSKDPAIPPSTPPHLLTVGVPDA